MGGNMETQKFGNLWISRFLRDSPPHAKSQKSGNFQLFASWGGGVTQAHQKSEISRFLNFWVVPLPLCKQSKVQTVSNFLYVCVRVCLKSENPGNEKFEHLENQKFRNSSQPSKFCYVCVCVCVVTQKSKNLTSQNSLSCTWSTGGKRKDCWSRKSNVPNDHWAKKSKISPFPDYTPCSEKYFASQLSDTRR